MYAYDLDGTLAGTRFTEIFSKAQLIDMYKKAPVLYRPTNQFVVITARGEDLEIKQATRLWLQANFGEQCVGVYFVSGTEEEKIKSKAAKVKELNLDGYVDAKLGTLQLFERFGITGINLYKLNLADDSITLWKKL